MEVIGDRYEILAEIGAGGMGIVFHGLDRQTNQPVAIKQLNPVLSQPELIERFRREGQILRQLNHPNIVKMMDALDHSGQFYLVLEYVSGGDLNSRLKAQILPVEQTLKIGLELADALTRAHHLKIIHRDLKPANVLIAEDGTPRLTDFGAARIDDSEITRSDIIIGTSAYLSPEAWISQPLDQRADIWSFGVMLFEMLSGQRPFQGTNPGALMNAILNQATPDLDALRPNLSPALVEIVNRMLNKDRDQRINSMRLVGAELEALLNGTSVSNTTLKPTAMFNPANEQSPVGKSQSTPTPTSSTSYRLPAQVTPFVGREKELREINDLLSDPQIRLVTLLGTGGTGKTRLSVECAGQQQFRDGVYFVPLASIEDTSLIARAIADAVQFQLSGPNDPQQQLADFFRDKSILLVMDNFEHLTEAAGIIHDLLQAANGLKVLATSRTRLNLQSETAYRLDGMDYPESANLSPEEAAGYSGVGLFAQSARRVQSSFKLGAGDVEAVVRICHAVQGLPLGIVLAASWVEMLSVKEIADEIVANINFLESEQQDIPTRQRSIQAVFDYSWNLLTPEERTIFMQLSIFRGGFTREAAQAICGASLKAFATLTNKMLIQRDPSGRYQVQELLRQFAVARLQENRDEFRMILAKHADYYLALLDSRQPGHQLHGPQTRTHLALLRQEHENIFAAFNHAIELGKLDKFLSGFETLILYAFMDERWLESIHTFRSITSATGHDEVEADLQHLVYALSNTAIILFEHLHEPMRTARVQPILEAEHVVKSSGNSQALRAYYLTVSLLLLTLESSNTLDVAAIRPLLLDAIEFSHQIGAPELEGWACGGLADVARVEHDPSGFDYARQILEIARRTQSPYLIANGLFSLAGPALFSGNLALARQNIEEALNNYSDLLSPFVIMLFSWLLAEALLALGELDQARQKLLEIMSLARKRGTRVAVARSLITLAKVARIEGELDLARAYFDEALSLFRETGDPIMVSQALVQAEQFSLLSGGWANAVPSLRAAFDMVRALHVPQTADAIVSLAYTLGKLEHPESAVEVIVFMLAQPGIPKETMQAGQQYLADLRTMLSTSAYEGAERRAQRLTADSAVALLDSLQVSI